MSDTWFIDGHDMKADNGHTHLSIGLPKSTWNMDCGNAGEKAARWSYFRAMCSNSHHVFLLYRSLYAKYIVFSVYSSLRVSLGGAFPLIHDFLLLVPCDSLLCDLRFT